MMAKDIIQHAFSSEHDENMHSDILEALLDSIESSGKPGFDKQRYICPVSTKPFKNPVIAGDGCVYDKESLENARLSGQEVISHATGNPIDLDATMSQNSDIARELNGFIDDYNIANGKPLTLHGKIKILISSVVGVIKRFKESAKYICSKIITAIRSFFSGCRGAILEGLSFIVWLTITVPRVLLLLPLYLIAQFCISIIQGMLIRLLPSSSNYLDHLQGEIKIAIIYLFTRMYFPGR